MPTPRQSGKLLTAYQKTYHRSLLPENVAADLTKVALSGHSRGGKTAFALALGHAEVSVSLKFSVLIGIDPVAGAKPMLQTLPHPPSHIYVPRSFDLNTPVAVIGTGLGLETKNDCIISKSCAPQGLNHKEFFNECKPPCAHFMAKDYGHMDMLDDDPPGVVGAVSGCMCKNGSGPRDHMRKSLGGIVVAFVRFIKAKTKTFNLCEIYDLSRGRVLPLNFGNQT